jgi:hypothetical protein
MSHRIIIPVLLRTRTAGRRPETAPGIDPGRIGSGTLVRMNHD